jgi:dipeptidyl aminopeptidase/acylaminoacyl peptidase
MNPRLSALGILAFLGAATAGSAEPLSAEELFRAAPLGEASLSPDGKYLGTVVADGIDTRSLMVYDLKDLTPTALRGTDENDISTFRWIANDKLVFSLTFDKIWSQGLYAAQVTHITDFYPLNRYNATVIVGVPEARPGKVLLWYRSVTGNRVQSPRITELDADQKHGNVLVRTIKAPRGGTVDRWWSDRRGELALCRTWSRGRFHLFRYAPASDEWTEVPIAGSAMPMGMDYDSNFVWVAVFAPGKGYELRRCNLTTGVLDEPVLTDPSYDIGTGVLYFSRVAQRLAGVMYVQRQPVSFWFLREFKVAQVSIDKLRPDTDNTLVDYDKAERMFLFAETGPQHPGTRELLDLGNKTIRGLGDAAPWLKDRPLHPVKPMTYKTRDGVRLEGYVSIPDGASAAHPVPLVVLVHGGPWVRDTPEYNPEVQFLVSRGYAVLQPNYRGSSGFTPEISRDHRFNFSRMHDDVTDATRGFLKTGIIDPKHVAIMGGSFGGYLAVAGVAFEGDLYCCAVTEAGVFDWRKQLKDEADNIESGESIPLLDEAANPAGDLSRLDEISPINHADRIHAPVLIAHGIQDGVVDVEQSRKLARVLKERGVPVETFFRRIEGHGFFNYKDRVDFYHQVEAFLAAHLGGETLTAMK